MSKNKKVQGKLLVSFDCTRDYPAETYLEHGATRIVETKAGKYREADVKPRGRFAYRFAVEKVGHPHVVIVRYPDDRQRMMCISDGIAYDMTMGIFTGWNFPLSHAMQEARMFFFPRWTDCAVQIVTWGNGEPAAASVVEVWELADCAPFKVPGDTGDGSRRELGSQWEDPCGYACAEGALDHAQWTEHVLAYARHSGQNLITYPMSWYYGPQFPSRTNTSDNTNVMATPDHKLWMRATCDPVDWWTGFLKRASEEGVGVVASHTLIRLSSLLEDMNIDLPSIQAGADTYNNMKSNNKVQVSCESPGYHAKMMLERFRHIEAKGGKQSLWQPATFPWRETHGSDVEHRPLFNPLHPVTQAKVLEYVGEVVDRYGQWPAFRGVSFNLFVGSVLWFGALDTGYDDYTMKLFQEETGLKLPGEAPDPERFAKRHAFLAFAARSLWIEWRCRKIRDWVRRIRDRIVSARPDLQLTITAYQELISGYSVLFGLFSTMSGFSFPILQPYARPTLKDILLEGGLDLDMLGKESGVELDLQIGESRDRIPSGSVVDGSGGFFCDLHRDLFATKDDALVYFARTVACDETKDIELCLGYDGPVKVWVDGKTVFHDPNGTNPAFPDKAVIPWPATKGQHEILIALSSNHGKAWGLCLRFRGKGGGHPGGNKDFADGDHVLNWLVSRRLPSAGKLDALAYPGDKQALDLKPRDFGAATPPRVIPLEETCIYRDANYLDQATLDAFAGVERNGAFIGNSYAEDWPQTIGFQPDPNDPSLALVRDMDGKPAEGFVRMNCLYPKDGWWFESQFRIYDPMPSGEHYLEPFAHAVAEMDAQRVTQGGLFMDKCHTDELRQFALAFRALPKQKFQTVGARTDPVAVRTLVADGKRYFYLVNREYYPIKVRVEFSRAPSALVDLSSGEKIKAGATWNVTLGAYELRSMSVEPKVDVVGFKVDVPDKIKRNILADSRRVLAEIEKLGQKGRWIAGMDRLAGQIRAAIKEERLAWLRRALTGYIARKAGQVLAEQKDR